MSTSSIERVSIGNEVLVLPDYFLYGSKITSLYIPNSVTTIGSSAFSNCSCLTSATIGKSVTAISGQVFESCSNLTSLYFNAENCSDFEESPFRDSPINTIVFGNNVQTVPAKIASGLKTVTNVIFGDSVNTIGKDAFGYCEGLTSVTIPNSVTTIDDVAFQCCSGLTSVNIGNSVITIGLGAFACCSGLTNITIPNSVTTIGNFAFYYCLALTSVTIPNSVTAIGNETFSSCNSLTGIIIPNSVTSISEDAFLGCCGLTNITVASGNPYYDSRDNCNAIIETASNSLILGCMNTVIPNSVTSISYEAFYDCRGLSSITIPNSVTSIENYAFSGCSGLNEIYSLALAPPTIDSNTFNGCYGATLFVPEDAYEAYKQAEYWKNFNCIVCIGAVTPGTIFVVGGIFYRALNASMASVIANEDVENYYIAEVVIPDSVTYEDQTFAVAGIENNAFSDCYELTSVTIPNSVETIGEQAFQGCTGLTSVTIGSGVTAIGAKAFNYCNALETVKCLGTVPPVMASTDCFSTAAYNRATLLVPRNSESTYSAADYWYKFAHIEGWGSAGRGDIDGDGEVSIRDVTTMIDAILTGEHEGVYFESADLNSNGRLDIGDVISLIDELLNGND